MDRFIYTAMQGAREIMLQQATNNHNLANINTTGFRADFDAVRSLPVYGPGLPTRVTVQDAGAGIDFAQGEIITTGNDLDVAIQGDGFIAVQAPDGSEAYTRAGELRISASGILETAGGHPVLGNGGPIAIPPYQKLEIGADGTISIQPMGQEAATLAVVDRIRLVKPPHETLKKGEDGLIRTRNGEPAPPDAGVRLITGAVEGSNVSSVQALVTMIELARQFEMHVNLLREAKEADTSATRVLQLNG